MAVAEDPITIEGLRDFQRALRQMDGDLPRKLRLVGNEAAELVIDAASPYVPRGESGKARASLVARSSQREAIVRAGGRRAPYYPWLDFGGKLPRGQTRRFFRSGRFIYPAFARHRGEILEVMLDGISDLSVQTADLVKGIRPSFVEDVKQLRRFAGNVDRNKAELDRALQVLPIKLEKVGRTAIYGSWFNFYLCSFKAHVTLPGNIKTVDIPQYSTGAKRCDLG